MWYPVAEAPHEGAAAVTEAHHADEEDEAAMDGARAVPAPLPSPPTARVMEAYRVAHTLHRAWCEACMRERGRNADHKRLAAEQGHVMDTVSLDFAFFGEPGQTTKLVLILREHNCSWTEAPFVQSKGGQDLWVAQAVADMVRRTRLQRLMFKFDQVPSILGLKSKVVAELGGSKDVSMEASLVNGHQSNGVVERAVQTVGGRKQAGA